MPTSYEVTCPPICACLEAAATPEECCECWRTMEYVYVTFTGTSVPPPFYAPEICAEGLADFSSCSYCFKNDIDGGTGIQIWGKGAGHPCGDFDCNGGFDMQIEIDCEALKLYVNDTEFCNGEALGVDFCSLSPVTLTGFEPWDWTKTIGCLWLCTTPTGSKCFSITSITVTPTCHCEEAVDCWDECCHCCGQEDGCTETYMNSASFMKHIVSLIEQDKEIKFSELDKKYNINLLVKRKFILNYIKSILYLAKKEKKRNKSYVDYFDKLAKGEIKSDISNTLKEYINEANWVYNNNVYTVNDKIHVKLEGEDKPIVLGRNLSKEVADFEKFGMEIKMPIPVNVKMKNEDCGCNKKREVAPKKVEKKIRKIF